MLLLDSIFFYLGWTMKKSVNTFSVLLYTVSGTLFAAYITLSILAVSPLYRVAVLLIICAAVYFGSLLQIRGGAEREKAMKITFLIFFALYALLLGNLLFFDGYFGRTGFIASGEAVTDIRLRPFATITGFLKSIKTGGHTKEQIVTNLLGNLVAFMPLSLFLPLYFKGLRRIIPFILVVMALVLAVEVLQVALKTGVGDIDDLILNTFGALLAFYILKIPPIKKLVIRFTKLEY